MNAEPGSDPTWEDLLTSHFGGHLPSDAELRQRVNEFNAFGMTLLERAITLPFTSHVVYYVSMLLGEYEAAPHTMLQADPDHMPAILLAVGSNQRLLVSLLLQHGAPINGCYGSKHLTLMEMAWTTEAAEAASFLLNSTFAPYRSIPCWSTEGLSPKRQQIANTILSVRARTQRAFTACAIILRCWSRALPQRDVRVLLAQAVWRTRRHSSWGSRAK